MMHFYVIQQLISWMRSIHSAIWTTNQLAAWLAFTLYLAIKFSSNHLLHSCTTFSKPYTVMKMGVSTLTSVDLGMKVNGKYYHDLLLAQQMLPSIKAICYKMLNRTTNDMIRSRLATHKFVAKEDVDIRQQEAELFFKSRAEEWRRQVHREQTIMRRCKLSNLQHRIRTYRHWKTLKKCSLKKRSETTTMSAGNLGKWYTLINTSVGNNVSVNSRNHIKMHGNSSDKNFNADQQTYWFTGQLPGHPG